MSNISEIIQSEKLVLVDFFATWCQPCKTMHPVFEQLKQNVGDSIRILKVDIDNNEDFASLYQVQSVPTFILFKDGVNVWRQSGAMSLSSLMNVINQYR